MSHDFLPPSESDDDSETASHSSSAQDADLVHSEQP